MQFFSKPETHIGSADIFTGVVEVTPLKPVTEKTKITMSKVHFKAGARSAWHTHPHGQTLYITEGEGLIQKRGEPIQTIRIGDVIWTEPGEEHWHGASADGGMTHLAIQELDDDGNLADWGEHVTDNEYNR